MFYPMTVTVSPGATGPVYGMAGVRMTEMEVARYAQTRLTDLKNAWNAANRSNPYLLTTNTESGQRRERSRLTYLSDAENLLRSKGFDLPTGLASRVDSFIERNIQMTGIDAALAEAAFGLFSNDFAEEGFGKAKRWTQDFLKTVQEAAASPDLVDFTANALWERTGLISFDIPLLGTYTLADVRDNLASVDDIIGKINAIDFKKLGDEAVVELTKVNWTEAGRAVILAIAPKGGIADTGLKAVGTAIGLMQSVASAASAIGALGASAAITSVLAAVSAALPVIMAVLVIIAVGEMIWASIIGQSDADDAAQTSRQVQAVIGVIQDLVGASASVQADIAGTVTLRCYEMAAYGSPIRHKLWASAKSANYARINAVEVTKNAAGCWSDGYAGTRDGAANIFGDNTASDKRNRLQWMRMALNFLLGVQSNLASYDTLDDRRLAFEYLGTLLIPPRKLNPGQPPIWKFYTGLWAPTRPSASSKFKASSLSPALSQLSRGTLIRQSLPARTIRIGGYLDTTGKKLNPQTSSSLLPLLAVGALVYFGSKA